MKFKVMTIFNVQDGYSDGLFIARSEKSFVRDFLTQMDASNKKATELGRPTQKPENFQVRLLGLYDDEATKIELKEPYEIVPMVVEGL